MTATCPSAQVSEHGGQNASTSGVPIIWMISAAGAVSHPSQKIV